MAPFAFSVIRMVQPSLARPSWLPRYVPLTPPPTPALPPVIMGHVCVWASADFAPIIRTTMLKRNKILFIARASGSYSGSRQEIDRIDDGHRRYDLGAEVERLHPLHHLRRKVRRLHVGSVQLAQGDAAVGLDRQAQDHLSLECWIPAQLEVVQPIELGLVTIEDDLYFLIGTSGARPAAHRTVRCSACADAGRGLRQRPAVNRVALGTAAQTAAYGREVDSTARAWCAAGQHRAFRSPRRGGAVVDTRLSAELRIDLRIGERGQTLLEHHESGRLRFRRSLHGRLGWLLRLGRTRLLRCRLLNGFLYRDLRWRRQHARRRRRPRQRHRDVEHLLGRCLRGRLRERQWDQRKNQCQKEADCEHPEQRLRKSSVILSAPGPGHRQRSRMKPADLPLDDPLLLAPFFLVLCFEQLVLDQTDMVLLLVDLFASAVPARLELAHAALEDSDAFAHPAQLQLTGRDRLRSTPEQL